MLTEDSKIFQSNHEVMYHGVMQGFSTLTTEELGLCHLEAKIELDGLPLLPLSRAETNTVCDSSKLANSILMTVSEQGVGGDVVKNERMRGARRAV